jgi:hypothetical protein
MRSLWIKRGIAAAAVTAAAGLSAPLQAQTLPNSVTCVYDALAPEQREIMQYLLVKLDPSVSPFTEVEKPGTIKSVIDEGIDACIARYPWPMGKTKNAQYFALVALLLDAMRPQLDKEGHETLLIDAYVEANSTRWKVPGFPTPAEEKAALAHFKSIGWTFADEREEGGMISYFGLAVARFHLRRGFATGQFYR